MNKIRVAGAIASQAGVTLYLENGSEVNLPQASWRTKAIMNAVVEPLSRHEVVELNLDDFSVERRIEQRTNGLIRIFRRVGEKLGLVSSGGVGSLPANPANEAAAPLVAIVNGKEIHGVEALEKHMEIAAYGENAEGFKRFMERIAAVIDERGHTIKELLVFMQRADLPIANDGSIVAYKVLQSADDGRFVDCATKKVSQALGSVVSQANVDESRREQCSTGLHIARRGYLRAFHGDVITLVKIAPEDVVAVPLGEPDKMRVRAYHIVGVLPEDVHATLRENKPMTYHPAAAKLLADVIAGDHVGVLEYVRINGTWGNDVTIEKVGDAPARNESKAENGEAKALDDIETFSVKEIKKKVDQALEKANKAKKKATARKAAAAPAPKKQAPEKKKLPEKYKKALKMLAAGKSQREVERELHICRKTLRKLLREQG